MNRRTYHNQADEVKRRSPVSAEEEKNQVFYRALGWMQRVLVLTWILLATLIVIAIYPAFLTAGTPLRLLTTAIYALWVITSLPVVLFTDLRDSLWLYLAATTASAAVITLSHYLVPDAGIIFFALFPLIWMSTNSLRRGTLASIAVVVAALLGISADTGFPPDITTTTTVASSGLVSIIIGFWMNWVFNTAETHWVLAQQLKEAQADLELLSHDRGVIEERERFATEIHDTVAQGFLSIVTMSRLAQRSNHEDKQETTRLLKLIESAAQHNLEEARQLVHAGAPPDLESDLVEALHRLSERTESETALTVELSTSDTSRTSDPIASNIAVVVLRCAQEALTNAQRHSQADRVEIDLIIAERSLTLRVADNGIGFDSDAAFGIGLSMMKRRVDNIGGELEITSEIDAGTSLVVKIGRPVPSGPTAPTGRVLSRARPMTEVSRSETKK